MMISPSKAHRRTAGSFPLDDPQIRGQINSVRRNVCVSPRVGLKSELGSDGLFVSKPYLWCTVWLLKRKSNVHMCSLSSSRFRILSLSVCQTRTHTHTHTHTHRQTVQNAFHTPASLLCTDFSLHLDRMSHSACVCVGKNQTHTGTYVSMLLCIIRNILYIYYFTTVTDFAFSCFPYCKALLTLSELHSLY